MYQGLIIDKLYVLIKIFYRYFFFLFQKTEVLCINK